MNHCSCVLLYGSKTMIWREKEKSWIRVYRWTASEVCWVLGEWIGYRMCRLGKCVEWHRRSKVFSDGSSVLKELGRIDRIAEKVCVGECVGRHLGLRRSTEEEVD